MDLDPHSPGAISSYHEVLRGERERERGIKRWISMIT